MDTIQKDIIILLKSSIIGDEYNLSDEFDMNNIMDVVTRHTIAPLIFWGATNCNLPKDDPNMVKLFSIILSNNASKRKSNIRYKKNIQGF